MTAEKTGFRGPAALRWLFAAVLIFAVLGFGLFPRPANKPGLFFIIFGNIAAAFLSFSRREIGAAFRNAAGRSGSREELRRAAYFWQAAARNAWMLGVLGSALNFTLTLSGGSVGIENLGGRMIQSLLIALYGLVLAVVCLVPYMKISGMGETTGMSDRTREPGPFPPARSILIERLTGYALISAVVVITIYSIEGHPQRGYLPIGKVLLHGPAFLIVFGGAIVLALFMGPGARALTLGFALTGLISLLMGLIQALFGFVHASINEISAALSFVIASSWFSLLGLVLIASPLQDREVMEGRRDRPDPLSRLFWCILPLIAFIFLILTFIMVMTPMKQPGGG